MPNNNSDQDGEITFSVSSASLGAKTVAVKVDNQLLETLSINVVQEGQQDLGINYGDLIKASTPAVYYYGADGRRYVFPNLKTYMTWYDDFSSVKTITDEQLAAIPIGGNITYKPGVKMVKINTDPKVYAVDLHATLRWVKTEELARSFYGDNWVDFVEDVPDAFFTNYQIGEPIELLSDFNPMEIREEAESINKNKQLLDQQVTS